VGEDSRRHARLGVTFRRRQAANFAGRNRKAAAR